MKLGEAERMTSEMAMSPGPGLEPEPGDIETLMIDGIGPIAGVKGLGKVAEVGAEPSVVAAAVAVEDHTRKRTAPMPDLRWMVAERPLKPVLAPRHAQGAAKLRPVHVVPALVLTTDRLRPSVEL